MQQSRKDGEHHPAFGVGGCRAGADWTGSVSLRAVSSPWGGRCSRNSIIPDYCFKSIPTIYCAELFAQKDKNTFLVSVQVKHALLGRVIRMGSGMGTGVLVPEELFPSKFIQADVPWEQEHGFRLICLQMSDSPHTEMKGQEKPLSL